jgi:hypothetical protein
MDKKTGMTIGSPNELRLNGSIENFFRCDGIVFDRETGFFRIIPQPPEGGVKSPLGDLGV